MIDSGVLPMARDERRFAPAQGAAKVGKRVRTLVEFSGVPKGTTGIVTRYDEGAVAIAWDLPHRLFGTRTMPLVDWFDRAAYDRYLAELD